MAIIKLFELIKSNNVRTKKKFGQNFLKDENIINKILDSSSIDKSSNVIEIGPGLGSLTFKIKDIAKKVVAYEIDTELSNILSKEFNNTNVDVVNKDILKINIDEEIKKHFNDENVVVIGNLPYYITTPIIMKFLEETKKVSRMIFMMQKEVGERLTAVPKTKEYNQLTIITNIKCDVKKLLNISKNVFIPKPEVESVVVEFSNINNTKYEINKQNEFINFVKNSFTQKRKTLVNNIYEAYNIEKNKIEKILYENNFSTNIRAEEISINDFIKLFNIFEEENLNVRN